MGQLNIVGKTDSLSNHPLLCNSFLPSLPCITTTHPTQPPVFVSISLPLVVYKMIYLLKRMEQFPQWNAQTQIDNPGLVV